MEVKKQKRKGGSVFAQLVLRRLLRHCGSLLEPYLPARFNRLEPKLLHRIARLQHPTQMADGLARPLVRLCSRGVLEAESQYRPR
jgi:hypothetical protein